MFCPVHWFMPDKGLKHNFSLGGNYKTNIFFWQIGCH